MTSHRLPVLVLVLFAFTYRTYGSDYTITSPKVFRVGATQKVILNLHGYRSASIRAYLQTLDLSSHFSETNIQLQAKNLKKPIELKFKIRHEVEKENIPNMDSRGQFFINLVVEVLNCNPSSGRFRRVMKVLVSKESGYLFAITNQPVYRIIFRPKDSVEITVFTMDQSMKESDLPVQLLIKAPPHGVGIHKENVVMKRGHSFAEYVYDITENPVFGKWSVEATYDFKKGYVTKTETEFLVERYVLPTFQVLIHLKKEFILTSDNTIEGSVEAKYSYGEPVLGAVRISMKVKKSPTSPAIEFYTIPESKNSADYLDGGKTSFSVDIPSTLLEVLKSAQTLDSLLQSGAYVVIEATVRETSTGNLESSVSNNIPILSSAYVFDKSKTSPFYIPGLQYNLKVILLQRIGKQRVTGVKYEVLVNKVRVFPKPGSRNQPRTNKFGQVSASLGLKGKINQNILIRTLGDGKSETTLNLVPYQSPSNSFLQISIPPTQTSPLKVKGNLPITFRFNQKNVQIRYVIVARGSVVHSGVSRSGANREEKTEYVEITQKMVPSGRIVAYYIYGSQKEVVSNSLWFDVVDRCKTDLSVSVPKLMSPQKSVKIEVKGARNSLVKVKAVDRAAYFLFGESRLTPQTMFDKMEDYDQGCSANGGKDGTDVFWQAGLALYSAKYNSELVTTLNCSSTMKHRKKRQAEDVTTDNYIENKLIECIRDGEAPHIIPNDTCQKRAERCKENYDSAVPGCSKKFLDACIEAEYQRKLDEIRNGIGREAGENAAQAKRKPPIVRNQFNPNMIDTTVILNNRGVNVFPSPVSSHSISTFEVDAASLANEEDGFCVANKKTIRVFKDIFIQVITPYALKIREQANIRVTVYNYGNEDKQVTLQVKPAEDQILCTRYDSRKWNKLIDFHIRPRRSASTVVTVLPLRIPKGDQTTSISFQARDSKNHALDTITKPIRIEESGVIEDTFQSYPILLTGKKGSTDQKINIDFKFPRNFVPNSRQCWIYAYSSFLGPTIEVDQITKEPRNIDSLFRIPCGCGEQNMIRSAPNVYAHMYLQESGKLKSNKLTYSASIKRIEAGYANQLNYLSVPARKKASAVFRQYQPSTWLNAFVNKVFVKAKEYDTDLDIAPICSSLRWLLTQQQGDGHFRENQVPIHREMHGAVGGALTLTAYVAISMLETQSRCSPELNQKISAAVENAMSYLARKENSATFARPYALALYSYALALHQPTSPLTKRVFTRLENKQISLADGTLHWEGRSANEIRGTDIHAYWYRQRPLAVHIEATAYALLALITKARTENPTKQSALDQTRRIVLWLIGQRNEGGAFMSTQDTVIGLQALATYEAWISRVVKERISTDFTIALKAPGLTWKQDNIKLTDSHTRYREEVKVPQNIINGGRVIATVKGVGKGILSYRCIYRTVVDEESCHFVISKPDISDVRELTPHDLDQIKKGALTRKFKITFSVTKIGNSTEMTIVEAGMMSGFEPVENSIGGLSTLKAVDGVVDRYEINKASVVFYIRKISNKPTVLSFQVEQKIVVLRPEPAKIKVYDYYEPSVHCSIFYSLGEISNLVTSNCDKKTTNDDLCKCAEGGCMTCRSRAEQLTKTWCYDKRLSLQRCASCQGKDCIDLKKISCNSSTNYVYEIRVKKVQSLSGGNAFYSFTATIRKILKYGDDSSAKIGKTISFLARGDCFRKCNDGKLKDPDKNIGQVSNFIKSGGILLVMGAAPEKSDINGKYNYQYRLDDNALLERVIPKKACNRYTKRKCENVESKVQKQRCKKPKRLHFACLAYERLKEKLEIQGCD